MMCHGVSLAVGGILLRQCRVFLQISWPNQLWCPNDFFRKNQLPWRQWRPCCKADHPLWPREPSSRFAMSKWRNLNVWLDASELGKWRPPKKGGWKLFKTGAFGNRVDVFLFLFPRCFLRFNVQFETVVQHDAWRAITLAPHTRFFWVSWRYLQHRNGYAGGAIS